MKQDITSQNKKLHTYIMLKLVVLFYLRDIPWFPSFILKVHKRKKICDNIGYRKQETKYAKFEKKTTI